MRWYGINVMTFAASCSVKGKGDIICRALVLCVSQSLMKTPSGNPTGEPPGHVLSERDSYRPEVEDEPTD